MLKTAIKILSALLAIVRSWQLRRELEEQQRAADELADNPVDWFSLKFGKSIVDNDSDLTHNVTEDNNHSSDNDEQVN